MSSGIIITRVVWCINLIKNLFSDRKYILLSAFFKNKTKRRKFYKYLAKERQSPKQLVLNFMDFSITRVIKLFNTFSSYIHWMKEWREFFFLGGKQKQRHLLVLIFYISYDKSHTLRIAAYISSLIFWIIKRLAALSINFFEIENYFLEMNYIRMIRSVKLHRILFFYFSNIRFYELVYSLND